MSTSIACRSNVRWKKMIGEPYSGKPNVRFDEGELEIEPFGYYASSLLYRPPRPPRSPAGLGHPERSASFQSLESSHGAVFQERLIWLGEAWLISIKRPFKCKVQFFHYVPFSYAADSYQSLNKNISSLFEDKKGFPGSASRPFQSPLFSMGD